MSSWQSALSLRHWKFPHWICRLSEKHIASIQLVEAADPILNELSIKDYIYSSNNKNKSYLKICNSRRPNYVWDCMSGPLKMKKKKKKADAVEELKLLKLELTNRCSRASGSVADEIESVAWKVNNERTTRWTKSLAQRSVPSRPLSQTVLSTLQQMSHQPETANVSVTIRKLARCFNQV